MNLVVDSEYGRTGTGREGVDGSTRAGRQGEAETDAGGMAELKVAAGRPDDVRVVARKGGDFVVNTLSSWAFRPNAADLRGLRLHGPAGVPTRPHGAFSRGAAVAHAGGVRRPGGKAGGGEIQDAEQKPVYQKTLTTNANGSIHDDIDAGAGGGAGQLLHRGEERGRPVMSGNFEVEEYKKPEYEVRVTTSKARVLEGESGDGGDRRAILLRRAGERGEGEVRGVSRSLLVPALVRPGGRHGRPPGRNRGEPATRWRRAKDSSIATAR